MTEPPSDVKGLVATENYNSFIQETTHFMPHFLKDFQLPRAGPCGQTESVGMEHIKLVPGGLNSGTTKEKRV